jgi:hypothetical protein
MLFMIACGSRVEPPALESHTELADSTGLPTAYASLFHDQAWAFELTFTDRATGNVKRSTAHCAIEHSHRVANRWVSSLGCYGDDAGVLADGSAYTLVATPAGLWRHADSADDADGAPLVTAPVRARRVGTTSIIRHHGGWCIVDAWRVDGTPDALTKTVCIRDTGLVGGGAEDPRAGGFVLRFGDAP